MSSERKNTGLRVALASYDVHQLRVWHQYIAEQSAEILCSEYRSGEELLQSLKQGRNTEVVVLGGPLEDMDSREFLERMSRLPQKPLLLLQDNARRERTAVSSFSPDGPCYLIRQSSLKELLASLLTAAGQESGTLEQRFGRMYQEWASSSRTATVITSPRRCSLPASPKASWPSARRSCRGWPSTTM